MAKRNFIRETRAPHGRICDFSVPAGYRDCIRSVSNKMNDTEHGAPRERERYLAFSDTRWLDSPVDPTAALLLLRENADAIVSPLKIISIFVDLAR